MSGIWFWTSSQLELNIFCKFGNCNWQHETIDDDDDDDDDKDR